MSEFKPRWQIATKTADNGVQSLVVETRDDSILPWHVTNWSDAESRQIASDLCHALNSLDEYRHKVYGYTEKP